MKSAARAITEPARARDAPAVIELPPARRRGVRRKAVNPANADIHLRVPPARKAAIRADARASGMTVSRYLLSNLPGASEPLPLVALADPLILTRIQAELGKWGSNWNQMTRGRNMTSDDPEVVELRRIGDALFDIRAALLIALGR
jgi:hypothetical protein